MSKTDLATKEITEAEAAAMLRAVVNLLACWRVTDAQARALLGQPSPATYERWRQGDIGAVPSETVVRLADLLDIHKALRTMFVDPQQAYGWISRPNDAFAGRSALDRMLEGTPGDIRAVRDYLDVERDAW